MEFEVLIIGSDINAYYMARCYHEAYKRKAKLIGKTEMSFTSKSNIIDMTIVPKLWHADIFVEELNKFAENEPAKKIVLVGTNDQYARMIVENKDRLDKKFVFNYPSIQMMDDLLLKDVFYRKFQNSGLPLPKTFVYSCTEKPEIPEFDSFPIILKPGDGVMYYKCEFPNKAKVFKIHNKAELYQTINDIENAGYTANLIIQEFIPGDDSKLFDSLFYCDKSGTAKLMTFAQIGLQEQTRTGVGNCTVLVNGFDEHGYKTSVVEKLSNFMDEIGFSGFAEFDMKYDERTQEYKVLEINPRQSRSGYYMTSLGYNMIELLVDDLVFDKKIEKRILKDKLVLSFVPNYCIKKYVGSEPLKKEIKLLRKNKKWVDPLSYKADMPMNRRIYLFLRKINYILKYRKNHW